MQIDQGPTNGNGATAGNAGTLDESLSFAEQQRRMVESIPTTYFVPQAITALREYYQVLDLTTHELEIAHVGGDPNFGAGENHLERLKQMVPTADAIMSRMFGEEVSPEGKIALRSAQKTINGAIEQYPKVPYFGADPSREFRIGKDLLGVALRMMELDFYRPAA